MDNRVEELVNKLNKLRETYYNGSSDIDDEEFDFYERELKTLDPENLYFDQVGSDVDSNVEEVEHRIPMLSMQKVQTAEEADKWIRSMNVPFVWVEPKFDGISGKIVYDSNGNFLYGATRGNGLIGAKVKYASEINSVPKHFYPNCELRGEFIIQKCYKSEFPNSPLRNVCGGILHRLDYSDDIKYITFIIYDVHVYSGSDIFKNLDRDLKIHKIAELIDPEHFKVERTQLDKSFDIYDTYDKYVKDWRDDWLFETDGVILTVPGDQSVYDDINSRYKIKAFNRFNMALKPPSVCCESEIVGIDIAVNRRKISYVALVKPVKLLDTIVSRATLDNYQKVIKNKVGIGTTVLIKKANDIIPKVYNFYNKPGKEINVPDMESCPACGSKLVPIYQDVMCPNEYGCVGVYTSKIENVFDSLDVKNIGIKVIEFIAKTLSKKIDRLYLSSFFSSIIPFGPYNNYKLESDIYRYYNGGKRPEIFKQAIVKMFDNLSEIKILGAFNIPYISEQSLINHKIRSYEELKNYVKELDERPVLTEVFDSTLYTWFKVPNNVKDLERTMELLAPFCKKFGDNREDGDYIPYCVSGSVPDNFKNKAEFEELVTRKNYLYKRVDDVTMNTEYLVTNERNTNKVIKAKKYGVKILSFDDFLNII